MLLQQVKRLENEIVEVTRDYQENMDTQKIEFKQVNDRLSEKCCKLLDELRTVKNIMRVPYLYGKYKDSKYSEFAEKKILSRYGRNRIKLNEANSLSLEKDSNFETDLFYFSESKREDLRKSIGSDISINHSIPSKESLIKSSSVKNFFHPSLYDRNKSPKSLQNMRKLLKNRYYEMKLKSSRRKHRRINGENLINKKSKLPDSKIIIKSHDFPNNKSNMTERKNKILFQNKALYNHMSDPNLVYSNKISHKPTVSYTNLRLN